VFEQDFILPLEISVILRIDEELYGALYIIPDPGRHWLPLILQVYRFFDS
jgi:hypothetical protein